MKTILAQKKGIVGTTLLLVAVASLIWVGVWRVQQTSHPSSDKLRVVTSFYPLYDFARQVGGIKVDVVNITPAGAEPHDYEPSPQQLVAASQSDIFVYNGGTLEPWVDRFVTDYHQVTVKASDGIVLQSGQDPHFWLDPVLAERIVDNIQAGLAKADPADKDYFVMHAAAYKAELARLNDDFRKGLATCQLRTIVTSHAAFGYLAKRYNLDVVTIAGISPDAEPSAAKLAEISQVVRDKGIHTIFFETLVTPRLAETIASETGAKTAVFNPLEGLTDNEQQQGKNYLLVQRDNLAALRAALACR